MVEETTILPHLTLPRLIYTIFEDRADTSEGECVFLEFEGRSWTYREFYHALTPIGNWLLKDLGVQAGEVVCLDGGNTPEFLMTWFALEALGACPAFINCNLTAEPLKHCVKLCDARYLIADVSQRPLVQPCENDLATDGIETLYYDTDFFKTLTDKEALPASRRKNINPQALACLIYTSGTTGMPKGTIINRAKSIGFTRGTADYLGIKPGTRMYTCLPLYHGAAHGLCVVPSIGNAGTVILSRKFSHKTFWPEVHASKATIIQYVGELCRYLVNAPPSPLDKAHSVEMAWGNGMRPDVWEVFRQRFGIETINELYAATDGLGATFNANRGPFSRNAIGVRGPLWHYWNSANEKRVHIDVDTQEILRNDAGFAIECRPGEAGEVLHRLDPTAPMNPSPQYYKNPAAGEKRLMHDVFEKGDLWFRSGDAMRLEVSFPTSIPSTSPRPLLHLSIPSPFPLTPSLPKPTQPKLTPSPPPSSQKEHSTSSTA
jgi:acyl-CoA synthetase (AMP-forming)/AMP-acid ligase II